MKKGKRTQAQYYNVNWHGLYLLFCQRCITLYEDLEELGDKGAGTKPVFAYDEVEAGDEGPLNQQLFEFYQVYLEKYLRSIHDSTIKEMLVDEFYDGLQILEDLDELPEDVEPLYRFLDETLAGTSPTYHAVRKAAQIFNEK